METTQTLKRPRLTETRDPNLYFEDGNFVLKAVHEGSTTYFRVHKSVLARHSGIFRGFFEIPLPDAQTIDGAMVMEVWDDPEAWRGLLNIIYASLDAESVFDTHGNDLAFHMLKPLALSRKFAFDALHDKIVNKLEAQCPSTLQLCDEASSKLEVSLNAHSSSSSDSEDEDVSTLDDILPDPASIIRLAQECDVPQLLPWAYYMLSTISPSRNYPENLECSDFSNASEMLTLRGARWDLLEKADLMKLMVGKHKIRSYIRANFHHSACSNPLHAGDPENCTSYSEAWWRAIHERLSMDNGDDPLTILRRAVDSVHDGGKGYDHVGGMGSGPAYTSACQVSQTKEIRQAFFNQIPYFFQLTTE